jgi:hypothetical protein
MGKSKYKWDFKRAREMIEAVSGIQAVDYYDLPTSGKRFEDGKDIRLELSGAEGLKPCRTAIDEALELGVPLHKFIFDVGGSTNRTEAELIESAQLAEEYKIEVIVVPEPRPTGDIGRQVATPEGIISGLGLRGADMTKYYVADILRYIDMGFRGFLVWDVGVLRLLNQLRLQGYIPKDVTFKVSIFAGAANPWNVQALQYYGANTVNPVADLTLPQLASIRQAVDIPIDFHVELWKSMGGFNRLFEAWEVARILSPVYFKIEPGPDLAMYSSWSEDQLAELMKKKVRFARNIIDIIEANYPELKVSNWGPSDLRVPVPQK